MTARCIGCGLLWNVSIDQKIPGDGYICPHCASKLKDGMKMRDIQVMATKRMEKRAERTDKVTGN